jgi:hypothetical protein
MPTLEVVGILQLLKDLNCPLASVSTVPPCQNGWSLHDPCIHRHLILYENALRHMNA